MPSSSATSRAACPWQVSQWTNASVINAGDGWHAHPTQALLDCYTIRTALNRPESFDGLKIAIVGDIKHSRVARSDISGVHDARRRRHARRTADPAAAGRRRAGRDPNLDDVIADLDVLYLLRMQQERMTEALVPSLREYTSRFGLTPARAERLPEHALIMHPGPMNRGVEMAVDPTELPGSVITQQVTNGIAVRMAVLFDLLGSGANLEERVMTQLLITGGTVLDQTGERRADVRVADGVIAEVADGIDADRRRSGASMQPG